MAFDADTKLQTLVEEIMEVIVVELCPEERVSVHWARNSADR